MSHQVSFWGNLGRDPELRYTADGKAVATVAVASKTQQSVKGTSKPIWFRVSCFDKVAEYISKYAQKGTVVSVNGYFAYDPNTGCPKVYKKQDGNFAANYDVYATTIDIVTGYKSSEQVQQAPQTAPQQKQRTYQQQQMPIASFDEDIPY